MDAVNGRAVSNGVSQGKADGMELCGRKLFSMME